MGNALTLSRAALVACALLGFASSGAQPTDAPPPTRSLEAPAAEAPASRSAAVESESARLREWLDARFDERLDFSPMEKTRLGLKENYDEIDDFSESAFDTELEWHRQTVESLRGTFDYALLSPEAQTSYDLWIHQYEQAQAARPFLRRGYVFSQFDGPHTSLPQFLINFHEVENADDMDAYVARIDGIARALLQALERAQIAADEGVRPPRFA